MKTKSIEIDKSLCTKLYTNIKSLGPALLGPPLCGPLLISALAELVDLLVSLGDTIGTLRLFSVF